MATATTFWRLAGMSYVQALAVGWRSASSIDDSTRIFSPRIFRTEIYVTIETPRFQQCMGGGERFGRQPMGEGGCSGHGSTSRSFDTDICTYVLHLILPLNCYRKRRYVTKATSTVRMALKEPAKSKAMQQEIFEYNAASWVAGKQGTKTAVTKLALAGKSA
eukprot:scaffold18803_cov53-Attheya_sp.AAC.3